MAAPLDRGRWMSATVTGAGGRKPKDEGGRTRLSWSRQAPITALFADAGVLAGERQAHALAQLHLDLAQHHNNLLRANLATSGHSGLLWFELILSISSAQK